MFFIDHHIRTVKTRGLSMLNISYLAPKTYCVFSKSNRSFAFFQGYWAILKGFSKSSDLKRHSYTHTGEKSHSSTHMRTKHYMSDECRGFHLVIETRDRLIHSYR